MQSSDPRHFFETDAEIQTKERRAAKSSNRYGNPIQLKSKILAAVVDPWAPTSTILVAESAGAVRRVNVDAQGSATTVYRGPTAPVCCVAVGGPKLKTLFAGSWDKAVWSWHLDTKAPDRKYVGHSDFVKAVVCGRMAGKDYLISGGADKKIIVWDIESGARLHTLQDSVVNMLSVQDLVIDHASSTADEISLFSASSDPHIRRWKIRADGWEQLTEPDSLKPGAERRTIVEHETTVYKLALTHPNDEEEEVVDLWTSSGDGTAKCLSRLRDFAPADTFNHGDHVRAVAVTRAWVITGGRDENLKYWNRATGALYCTLEGHFDEVTDLVVLRGSNGEQRRVCSVSIDGTVRTWPLETAVLDALVEEQEKPDDEEDEEDKDAEKAGNLLSADEEAELAALMEDDD
ncbi:WD40-repeat-containing domain protein [Apodospora peruviana]|uniref:WD40-repeat-containing domain protein n=1 Tax=Apodospora peruviana TaxID=516989 RepID=A0AAE0HYM9_9PEZI|nr:WD40-repeat-containing domain protein [Apodospora peruviana]